MIISGNTSFSILLFTKARPNVQEASRVGLTTTTHIHQHKRPLSYAQMWKSILGSYQINRTQININNFLKPGVNQIGSTGRRYPVMPQMAELCSVKSCSVDAQHPGFHGLSESWLAIADTSLGVKPIRPTWMMMPAVAIAIPYIVQVNWFPQSTSTARIVHKAAAELMIIFSGLRRLLAGSKLWLHQPARSWHSKDWSTTSPSFRWRIGAK